MTCKQFAYAQSLFQLNGYRSADKTTKLTSVKKLSWTFVGNVKLLYAEGVFIFKNEDKDAYFLLLFLNPKIEHFSLASNRTGKIDPSRGVLLVFDVYTFEPIIS